MGSLEFMTKYMIDNGHIEILYKFDLKPQCKALNT